MLAADAQFAYLVTAGHTGTLSLCRFDKEDGSYQPFLSDGQPRPFDLPLTEIITDREVITPTALAVHDDRMVMALAEGEVVVFDAASADVLRIVPLPDVTALAFDPAGGLYAIIADRVCAIDLETGAARKMATPGVELPGALAVDEAGNIVVFDAGADSQVKVYSIDGKLLRTAGKQGGRPWSGTFQPQAMMKVSSVAVDARGDVWAVESWNNPRRVSVWGSDAQLVRDYIGNTGYAGSSTYLDESDPTLAYIGPIEMRLDRASNQWHVTRLLWVPDPAKNQTFSLWRDRHGFSNPVFITSAASGQPIRYLYFQGSYSEFHALYMERGDAYAPVAALTTVGQLRKRLPQLALKGADKDGVFWNDRNADAAVSADECAVVPAPFELGGGWGTRMGTDLRLYVGGITVYAPTGFTSDGAPRYGPAGVSKLAAPLSGEFFALTDEQLLLNISRWRGAGKPGWISGFDLSAGAIRWRYPNPFSNVHGSHQASMPQPGLVIGPLKVCGVAHINDEIGKIFLIRGNLGQDFLFTIDGLYIGSLFQDTRLPAPPLPDSEAALRGRSMADMSGGGEPFSGWFGRHADGKIRLLTSIARQAGLVVEVKGLETIKRIDGEPIEVDLAILAKVSNAGSAEDTAETPSYTVRSLTAAPVIDGQADDWTQVAAMRIERAGSPERAAVRLAYDQEHLYLLAQVTDSSPMLNGGHDVTRLFKTGDAVDLQLRTGGESNQSDQVRAGDVRVVFSLHEDKPIGVLMCPVSPGAPASSKVVYQSPVMERSFDRVEVMRTARVAVTRRDDGYVLEAAIPLRDIGLKPQRGVSLPGDVGFVSSDATGRSNVARTYWSNRNTNLVNDLPHEAWLFPQEWGRLTFE